MGRLKNLWFAVIVMGFGGLLFGYDIGIISGAIVVMKKDLCLNDSYEEAVVSMVLAGGCVGVILAMFLADYIGRKKCLQVSSVFFCLGALILYFTIRSFVEMVLVGRFVLGLGVGLSSCTIPLFVAELSPAHNRGTYVSIHEFSIVFGILIAFLTNWILEEIFGTSSSLIDTGSVHNSTNLLDASTPSSFIGHNTTCEAGISDIGWWRLSFAVSIIPGIILFIGTFFIPESPRWLVSQGKLKEAYRSLFSLRDDNASVKTEFREIIEYQYYMIQSKQGNAELVDISQFMNENESGFSSDDDEIFEDTPMRSEMNSLISSLFINSSLGSIQSKFENIKELFLFQWKPLGMSLGLAMFVQFTGQPTVLFYSTRLLQNFSDSFTTYNAVLLLAIIPTVFKLLATGVSSFCIVEKWGRRIPLMVGYGLLSLILLSMSLALTLHLDHSTFTVIFLIQLSLYVIVFALSLGPLLWVLFSELFPIPYRTLGISFATASNMLFNYIVSAVFLTAKNSWGIEVVWVTFAVTAVIGIFFVLFLVPETSGMSLVFDFVFELALFTNIFVRNKFQRIRGRLDSDI